MNTTDSQNLDLPAAVDTPLRVFENMLISIMIRIY